MSLAGILGKPCVDFSQNPNDLGTHPASQSDHLAITQTSSSESLANALQLSVGASFSFGIYSGDLSANYAESDKFSRYSESLVIDTYIEKERRLIKSVKLSKIGEAARKRGQVQFFLTCGDEFIDGYVEGGGLYGYFYSNNLFQ